MIYLDWAASALPDLNLIKEANNISGKYYANPSAVHKPGLEAQTFLNECRKNISGLIGCSEKEIIFTSGGTESNNIVINSIIKYTGKNHKTIPHVIISSLEHDSVYIPAKGLSDLGIEVSFANVEKSGFISPKSIKSLLKDNTRLICVILTSNETGAVQPLADIVKIADEHSKRTGKRIIVHADAVQAFGKIEFNPYELGIDTASLSAHKIGGLRGVGALFVKKGCIIRPLYTGGSQEMGLRPGTENLAGVYCLSLICAKVLPELKNNYDKARTIMSKLIEELSLINNAVFIPEQRLKEPDTFSPYILKISFPPIPGEVLVRVLQDRGICISTGSACASRKKNKQRALLSMGISSETAYSAVRISPGHTTTMEDIKNFIKILKEELTILKRVTGI
jgi:cysteine desulfurase